MPGRGERGGVTDGTVLSLLNSVAAQRGTPDVRLSGCVDVLSTAVGATTGLLLHGGPDALDVRGYGPGAGEVVQASLPPQARISAGDDPLVDPLRRGSVRTNTARRAWGDAWDASEKRRACLAVWGCGEVVAVPVRAGSDFVAILMGRPGPDFSDSDLALLDAVQPAVAALAEILHPEALRPAHTYLVRLTARETSVLALLARGHTAAHMARLLESSPRTVHRHLSNIYAKLGVADRLSAVNRARDLGVLDAPEALR